MTEHRFPYRWNIKDSTFTKDKGKVFSCFAAGGGSSFGYKLAGFDVIGMNEIDQKMADSYIANHNPTYSFVEPIQDFKNRKDLPKELYELDILDGSPPCSSFSMVGKREKYWGKAKKFREGQTKQVLDTLFFDFIDLAKELQPKVIVAENVKGILAGNAKKYVSEVYKQCRDAGYSIQHFTLNASKMGVPQKRERVFFIALRNDLAEQFMDDMFGVPILDMEFNEPDIKFSTISQSDVEFDNVEWYDLWNNMKETESLAKYTKSNFGSIKIKYDDVMPTIIATQRKNSFHSSGLIHPKECRKLNDTEFILGGSFPLDYDFSAGSRSANYVGYVVGMSVPPVMMANIATEIYDQWLINLK